MVITAGAFYSPVALSIQQGAEILQAVYCSGVERNQKGTPTKAVNPFLPIEGANGEVNWSKLSLSQDLVDRELWICVVARSPKNTPIFPILTWDNRRKILPQVDVPDEPLLKETWRKIVIDSNGKAIDAPHLRYNLTIEP